MAAWQHGSMAAWQHMNKAINGDGGEVVDVGSHSRYRPPGRSVTARWKPPGPDSAGGTDHGVQFQSSRYCGYQNQTSSTSAVSARPLPVSPPPHFLHLSAMRYIRLRYCWLCSVTPLTLAARLFCLCHPCPRAVAVRPRDGTDTPSLIPSFCLIFVISR